MFRLAFILISITAAATASGSLRNSRNLRPLETSICDVFPPNQEAWCIAAVANGCDGSENDKKPCNVFEKKFLKKSDGDLRIPWIPSEQPSFALSDTPSIQPSLNPSEMPSFMPSQIPSASPTAYCPALSSSEPLPSPDVCAGTRSCRNRGKIGGGVALCKGEQSCSFNEGQISGDRTCAGDQLNRLGACAHNKGTICDGACADGVANCGWNMGTISGEGVCADTWTCQYNRGIISGTTSTCSGYRSCFRVFGEVQDGACNGAESCHFVPRCVTLSGDTCNDPDSCQWSIEQAESCCADDSKDCCDIGLMSLPEQGGCVDHSYIQSDGMPGEKSLLDLGNDYGDNDPSAQKSAP